MGSDWQEMPLDEIVVTNPDTYSTNEDWDYVNYLDTGSITEGQIIEIKKFKRGEKLPSRARRKVKHGDIIYSTVRPIQRHYGIITEPVENMLVSTGFTVIRAKEKKSDETFLYYFLTQDRIVEKLQTTAEHSTSTYPSIRPADIESLKINLPPLKEQRFIAHILGTLDDKIGLNRHMNETLEAMARAIFKSWFVNFDPVVFNAVRAGNPVPERFEETAARYRENPETQRLPRDILDLFPDRFEESELGEIPAGWEVGNLSDFADVTSGKRPESRSKNQTEEFNVPLYGGAGVMAYVKKPLLSKPFLLTGRVGTLGKVFRITEESWPSDNTLLLHPKNEVFLECIYFLLQEIDFDTLNRGSTQPLITQTDLKKHKIISPPKSNISFYWMKVHQMFEKIDKNTEELRTLALTRDTLLPKLISGELRVPDAEHILEVAVV